MCSSLNSQCDVPMRMMRRTLRICWMLTFTFLACVPAIDAEPLLPKQRPSPNPNRQATDELIRLTASANLLCANFELMLTSPPPETRHDDILLEKEFFRRFASGDWPCPKQEFSGGPLAPSARFQVLCWLAECNKRMLFDVPKKRRAFRDRLLAHVVRGLNSTSDPEQIEGFLDVAFRSVFYRSAVEPEDGGDLVVDILMGYVCHGDASVSKFARKTLRRTGFVWPSRHEDIVECLRHYDPESETYLSNYRMPSCPMDELWSYDTREGRYSEAEWISIISGPPENLRDVVEAKLESWRSRSAIGYYAFDRLLMKGCEVENERAFLALAEVARKGIRAGAIVCHFACSAAADLPTDKSEVMQQRLAELIGILPQGTQGRWYTGEELKPVDVLEIALASVKELEKSELADGKVANPANARVQQQLKAAIQALVAS